MAFKFTIAQGALETTPDYPAAATDVSPDRGLTVQTQPRVLKAQFGDGYEQRAIDGINTLNQTYNITFNNRPRAEIDLIVNYFDFLGGTTQFTFTVDDSDKTGEITRDIVVVCDSYSTSYSYDNVYSCQATFRRVYNP